MAEILIGFAAGILLLVLLSLARVVVGPTVADRMMGAQLAGTGGIAMLMLLAGATDRPAVLDVALVLALLAAFAVVGFAKATSPDGAGDPEESDPP
ncbi:MAG: portal protein [Pseudomonadales bacterium]|nr:portal protein [Pseudomonadales bacterium]